MRQEKCINCGCPVYPLTEGGVRIVQLEDGRWMHLGVIYCIQAIRDVIAQMRRMT